jgi:hypothetical protein
MLLYDTQIEAQRSLLRIVPKGYGWWLSGREVCKADLDARHAKYAEHYGCDLSPAKKAYRKKCGLANTHFIAVALPPEELEGGYLWFLIASDGLGEIRDNTKLKDCRTREGRITWGDYVLYEAPRTREEGGGTRWSWYIKPQVQKELDYYMGQLLKQAPHELPAFFEAQCRRPMHHGIRHYLARLLKRAHQNFGRMYPNRPWVGRDPAKPLPIIASYRV